MIIKDHIDSSVCLFIIIMLYIGVSAVVYEGIISRPEEEVLDHRWPKNVLSKYLT